MTDIGLNWDLGLGEGDILFANNDIVKDEGLETAVLISLFTDARAEDGDDIPDPDNDKRGWWGDLVNEDNGILGSRLWTLSRSKITTENLTLTEGFAAQALQWLIDDEIVSSISVTAERNADDVNRVDLLVEIKKEGEDPVLLKYDNLWENQINAI